MCLLVPMFGEGSDAQCEVFGASVVGQSQEQRRGVVFVGDVFSLDNLIVIALRFCQAMHGRMFYVKHFVKQSPSNSRFSEGKQTKKRSRYFRNLLIFRAESET